MMKYLTSPIAILLIMISGLALAAPDERPYKFLSTHSVFHLIGWALVPRIMFIFFSAISGGFFFWVGVILIPRIMVAYWASVYYWDTNMILCLVAWILAILGEFGEKICLGKCRR